MQSFDKVVSKVLVHEVDAKVLKQLQTLCVSHQLVGIRANLGTNTIGLQLATSEIEDVLRSNLDLGAVLLTEEPDEFDNSGLDLSVRIQQQRPDLPIFLRRTTEGPLPDRVKNAIAGEYRANNMAQLHRLMQAFINTQYFPYELASCVQEFALQIYESLVPGVQVKSDYPYLVRDQVIYGELLSLIPLETNWCKGYVMLQSTEAAIMDLIRSGCTFINPARPTLLDMNALFNEATNMIWGKLKARFSQQDNGFRGSIAAVPTLVNHGDKHISFGSTEPQLCLKHVLHDPDHRFPDVVVYLRLIFNLYWSPERFAESLLEPAPEQDDGGLELF